MVYGLSVLLTVFALRNNFRADGVLPISTLAQGLISMSIMRFRPSSSPNRSNQGSSAIRGEGGGSSSGRGDRGDMGDMGEELRKQTVVQLRDELEARGLAWAPKDRKAALVEQVLAADEEQDAEVDRILGDGGNNGGEVGQEVNTAHDDNDDNGDNDDDRGVSVFTLGLVLLCTTAGLHV